MAKLHLKISGMTCVNCSNGVEKVTKKLNGLQEAKVSFASNEGEFIYDEALLSREKIIEKVEKLGYKVHFDEAKLELAQLHEYKELKLKLIISALISIILMTFHHSLHVGLVAVLASIVQFYSGSSFYLHAYKGLKNNTYDMSVLVALGTSVAYFYSLGVVMLGEFIPQNLRFLYFDGAVMIISFVLLGKFLESRSKKKATDLIKSMMSFAPKMANVEQNGVITSLHVEELRLGDIVIIKEGEAIGCDGEVVEGEAQIDMSLLSGESLPVHKRVGDGVASATICKEGYIKVKVTKLHNQTLLAQIVALLSEAQNKKVPIGALADRVANVFVPSVITISILTFVVWYFFSGDFIISLLCALSVLIISCPCALGLATPISIVSAISRGAKDGILIKNPEIVELAKEIKYAVFDKTGTITKGEMEVSESCVKNFQELIYSLEFKNSHPISKAIVNHLNGCKLKEVDEYKSIIGKGLQGVIDGKKVLVGNQEFLEYNGVKLSQEEQIQWFQQNGYTVVSCAVEGEDVGYFVLSDEPKDEAKEVVKALKERGITTIMLTGDNELNAKEVAKKVGIDLVYAGVLPHQKHERISALQKDAKVLFVGDGINDSASLKVADVGICLSSGADISKDAGDAVLLNNDLNGVLKVLNLSQKSMSIIKQNLFWAFFYNILGIPIAAGVLYPFFGLLLTPMYASMAMSISSVSVVLNALRLRSVKL